MYRFALLIALIIANSPASAKAGTGAPPLLSNTELACTDKNYVAFLGMGPAFHHQVLIVFRLDQTGNSPAIRELDNRAKSGIKCNSDNVELLIEEPFPSPTFSLQQYSISNKLDLLSLVSTSVPTNQPVPAEFEGLSLADNTKHPMVLRSFPNQGWIELAISKSKKHVDDRIHGTGAWHTERLQLNIVRNDGSKKSIPVSFGEYLEAAD